MNDLPKKEEHIEGGAAADLDLVGRREGEGQKARSGGKVTEPPA